MGKKEGGKRKGKGLDCFSNYGLHPGNDLSPFAPPLVLSDPLKSWKLVEAEKNRSLRSAVLTLDPT